MGVVTDMRALKGGMWHHKNRMASNLVWGRWVRSCQALRGRRTCLVELNEASCGLQLGRGKWAETKVGRWQGLESASS